MVFASLSFMFILLPLFLAVDFIARYLLYKNKSYKVHYFGKKWLIGGGQLACK